MQGRSEGVNKPGINARGGTFHKRLGHQVLHDSMIIGKDLRPKFDSEDFVLDEIRTWINCLREQTCDDTRHFTVMGPNSMPVALAQLHQKFRWIQNPPKAFQLCFKLLVEHLAEISKVVLDHRVVQYASSLLRAPSVPPAHANAFYYFRHYRRSQYLSLSYL